MHKPICAAVLSVVSLLLSLTNSTSGAHAACLECTARIGAVEAAAAPAAGVPRGYAYTIQPGDTLWGIAADHGITVKALIAANNLADARLLRPGQTLWVPASPPAIVKPSRGAVSPEVGSAPATESGAIAPPAGKEGWPSELLSLINQSRAAVGLPLLMRSPELDRAAQAHAEDCARRNSGSHIGSDGAQLVARIAREGFEVHRASENWANAQSVSRAFALWWNEPPGRDPHRRNILDVKYTEIGIGVADGRWGTYFVADFAGP